MNAPIHPKHYADERTLQLSAPPVSAAQLSAYLGYVEELLRLLGVETVTGAPDAAQLAHAHETALKNSKLDALELEHVRTAVRRFTANRWTTAKLKAKLEELGGARAVPLDPPDVRDHAAKEIARQDVELAKRDAASTVELFKQHEAELMSVRDRLGLMLG